MAEERARVGQRVAGPLPAFTDRLDAGRKLASFVSPQVDPDALVFALPRGGVPVARPLADAARCPLLPVLVRKLPLPASPEMGFGAVTLDGTLALNDRIVTAYGVTPEQVERIAEEVRGELRRRAAAYPGGEAVPEVSGRDVYLVDDGLATGYTALAAADMLVARRPRSLSLAVPCAPASSLRMLADRVDLAYCLYEQTGASFAVASYYRSFPDLTDEEVRAALGRASGQRVGERGRQG